MDEDLLRTQTCHTLSPPGRIRKAEQLCHSQQLTGFPSGSDVRNSSAEAGDVVPALGWKDPLEREMATHSSILAWRIPWAEGPSRPWGHKRVGLDLGTKQQQVTEDGGRILPPALPPSPSLSVSSVPQSCPTLCSPMDRSTPGLPVHHQLLNFTHTHVHRVGDAIQPSHPLSSPSPPAFNLSQHQGLF